MSNKTGLLGAELVAHNRAITSRKLPNGSGQLTSVYSIVHIGAMPASTRQCVSAAFVWGSKGPARAQARLDKLIRHTTHV